MKRSVYRMKEILPEVRLTAEAILESKKNVSEKNKAIES